MLRIYVSISIGQQYEVYAELCFKGPIHYQHPNLNPTIWGFKGTGQ